MQFEYDPERLIEEVKKRPGIWDYENSNYRTVAIRLELWNEVIRELLQPSVKITKSETRELVLQLQKKWKSLKDSFQKYIHNPNRTKRPYIYSKQLQFLLKNEAPETENAGAGEASTESDEDRKKKKGKNVKLKRKKRMRIGKEDSSDDDGNNDTFVPQEAPRSSGPEEFAFASVDSKSSEGAPAMDCDRMFLLSLLTHLKAIPEESRLRVKMQLLQVLRNATL